MDNRSVIIGKTVYLYRQKAPFVPSGESLHGALEFDPATDTVKCHECGGWFKHVGLHAVAVHKVSAREYKRKHGLRYRAALCGEGVRVAISSAAQARENPLSKLAAEGRAWWQRPDLLERNRQRMLHQNPAHLGIAGETRNERMHCKAQLIADVRKAADELGRPPSIVELRDRGICYASLMLAVSASTFNEAMGIAGLPSDRNFPEFRYSGEQLLALLRAFVEQHKRPPSHSDMRRGLVPDASLYRRKWGTMRAAHEAAGTLQQYQDYMRAVRARGGAAAMAVRWGRGKEVAA